MVSALYYCELMGVLYVGKGDGQVTGYQASTDGSTAITAGNGNNGSTASNGSTD